MANSELRPAAARSVDGPAIQYTVRASTNSEIDEVYYRFARSHRAPNSFSSQWTRRIAVARTNHRL